MTEQIVGFLEGWVKAWGPGLLLALVMLYGLYKLLIKTGEKVGGKILDALEKPASALDKQAGAMDRLAETIRDYVISDRTDHKEMIILQKIVLEKIADLKGAKNDRNK